MRPSLRTALLCAALAAVAGCGDDEPAALPGSGAAYRALSGVERLAAAAACRDRAVAAADGVAADQIGRVDLDDQQKHVEPRARRVLRSAKRECEQFGFTTD